MLQRVHRLRYLLRWELLREVEVLLRELKHAGADKKLSNAEYDSIIAQLWKVGRVLRREG